MGLDTTHDCFWVADGVAEFILARAALAEVGE